MVRLINQLQDQKQRGSGAMFSKVLATRKLSVSRRLWRCSAWWLYRIEKCWRHNSRCRSIEGFQHRRLWEKSGAICHKLFSSWHQYVEVFLGHWTITFHLFHREQTACVSSSLSKEFKRRADSLALNVSWLLMIKKQIIKQRVKCLQDLGSPTFYSHTLNKFELCRRFWVIWIKPRLTEITYFKSPNGSCSCQLWVVFKRCRPSVPTTDLQASNNKSSNRF